MQSLWNEQDAMAAGLSLLQQRVYTSRLLGSEPSLVLHGGGNTSAKVLEKTIFGDDEDILWVKGSGWDLATITAEGFASTRLKTLQRLATLPALSDTDMMRELKSACTVASAPTPSVEAILHAIIPLRFVDHTHADAVVAITNSQQGEMILAQLYGDDVLVLPYVMPGFVLAQQIYEATRTVDWAKLKGIILLHHGVFTFHDDARTSYENMIELVDRAEDYLKKKQLWTNAAEADYAPTPNDVLACAELRQAASLLFGRPMLARWDVQSEAVGYSALSSINTIATRGPLTPDHALHTKPVPMIIEADVSTAVNDFAKAYHDYFVRHGNSMLTCLDTAPRVAVWQSRGMVYFSPDSKRLRIVQDIATHTRRAVQWGEALGGWQALPERELFDLEYWELEQAKLKLASSVKPMEGRVAIVSGAASGIGRATVEALVQQGACVAALDINPAITTLFCVPNVLGVVCDVTERGQLRDAVTKTVMYFGGVDMLVCNAGFFPASTRLSALTDDVLEKSVSLNFLSHVHLLQECLPYLERGFDAAVVMVASKNVPAPGPGAMAYSSAKAALTQMARVAAMELGEKSIRVNVVHPNAVFDTAIWDEQTLRARAAAYGVTIEEYKTSNVLKKEVSSAQVGSVIAALLSPVFACTTGAQIPVDGGNERVI